MERIRNLTIYSKILLLALAVMAIVFAVVYPVTISREGFLYKEQILVLGTEGGNTVYTAKVRGEEWRFTVTPDKTVTFRCGDKQYGPYTAKEDPTAIPAGHQLAKAMTGVEVREGGEILFRGGICDTGAYWMMVNEDGTDANLNTTAVLSGGTVVNGDNEIVDPMEPSVSAILKLMNGPELTHKGFGFFWFMGFFASLIAAAVILFADELFLWKFVFTVRDPEQVEPSDMVLAMRPIAWTAMVLLTLWIYFMGLK